MLTRQDLYFFLTALGQGVDRAKLLEASRACANEPDVDLPAMLLRQHLLQSAQVDAALQALGACLERNNWNEDAALQELVRAAGPERLGACWEALASLGAPAEHAAGVRQRYADGQLHGEGGLGRVWRARDARTGRIVALKELRPEFAGRAPALERFIQEAQITSQLDHPNIIPVYELHERPGDSPFYTMKFICCGTLQDALDHYHRQPPPEGWSSLEFRHLLIAFTKVCEAVAFAHSRGVLHRDLKPANVAMGDFGAVLVLDWGLAHRISTRESVGADATASERCDQTCAGAVIGTPAFMAPEQAAGDIDRLGPATDVYGLGATLFAILTGAPPHPSKAGESTQDYLARIISMPAPSPGASRSDLPPGLVAICARAMAQAPAERYASAADLAADIHRWLGGLAVTALPERWPQRLGRWLRQHPAMTQAVASAALLLVVTATVLITNSWAADRSITAVSRANLELEAKSLAEIYQHRIDDQPDRVRFASQLPTLAALLQDRPDLPLVRQHAEDLLRTAAHLRPEHLQIGVVRRATWVLLLTRDHPGAELSVLVDQPVQAQAMRSFLGDCGRLTSGQWFSVVVPPERESASATLWIGAKVAASPESKDAAYFVLVVDLHQLLQAPESTGLGGGYVHVASAAGTILTKPIAGEPRPAVGKIVDHNPALAGYFAARPLPEAGLFRGDAEDSPLTACRRLVVPSSVNPQELALVVERPLDSEAAESARARRLVMGLTALAIVAALALTYGLVRLLARPAAAP